VSGTFDPAAVAVAGHDPTVFAGVIGGPVKGPTRALVGSGRTTAAKRTG
jgi:hypothetical protein